MHFSWINRVDHRGADAAWNRYAFLFATVYIFVDARFPKDARASAQGLFNVMILGIGAFTRRVPFARI